MLHKLFTVYDEKAEVFLPPFFVPTLGIAIRAFKDAINSPDHQFGKHPGDYSLFEMGTFDDNNASLSETTKKSLGNGVEYIDPDNIDSLGDFKNEPPKPPI